jgi:hypothetical protein
VDEDFVPEEELLPLLLLAVKFGLVVEYQSWVYANESIYIPLK